MTANCCLFICLWLCALLHFGSASDIKCSCAHDGDKTKCVIAEESRVSDASNCSFSWLDADDSVLVNEVQKNPELVESYSINDLVTFKHLNKTAFSRHCPSENPKYTASCSMPGPTDPTVPPASTPTNGTAKGGDSTRDHMIAAFVVTVFLVVVVVILGVSRSRPKDETPRTQCCNQLGGIWTRVKTAEVDPEVALNYPL